MLPSFEILEPKTVKEACALLAKHKHRAKVIAGGQSLLLFLKEKLIKPKYLVSIQGIKNLDYMRYDARKGLSIGALTTHRTIESSKVVREKFPPMAETFRHIGSLRIRNVGTLGGNLCHADPRQDPGPTLLAMDAKVKAVGPKGTRTIKLEDFFVNYYETVLRPTEILTEISIPKYPARTSGAYVRFCSKTSEDTPAVEVAAIVTLDPKKEVLQDVRIGLGAVAATAIRARKAEAHLKGKRYSEELLMEAAKLAVEETDPVGDLRGSEEYKREMVAVMVKRGLREAFERARS
jgi:CO/xanthine dehydrogenase FAD-binding subunit